MYFQYTNAVIVKAPPALVSTECEETEHSDDKQWFSGNRNQKTGDGRYDVEGDDVC